jgi:hypothetical protein
MAEDIKFLHKGRFLQKEEASEYPVMVAGTVLPDKNLVYVFDSDQEFKVWIEQTKYSDRVNEIEETITELLKHKEEYTTTVVELHNTKMKRIANDLIELADRVGLDPGSEELFRRATIERKPFEPPIFDPAIGWEELEFGGNWLPLATPMPDLGRINAGGVNWDNIISSVRMIGFGVLCDYPWFGGHKVWLAGVPYWQYNLDALGFDNRTSSVFFN